MNNKYIILAVLCVIASFRISAQQNQTSKVELPMADLKALDKVILESKRYEDVKLSNIDSLKKLLGNPINISDVRHRWELNMEIGEQYKPLSSDSALYYFEKARNAGVETGSDSLVLISRIAVLDALSGAGIFTEAVSELESLETLPMPKSLQLDLWKRARQLYSYMTGYVAGHDNLVVRYKIKSQEYEDKLLAELPHTDDYYQFVSAERLVRDGRYVEAQKALSNLMERLPDDSNLYGMAAYQMAETYRFGGNETMYASYLAKSAISDEKGCIREGFSLPALANWLYAQGDLDRAFNYINSSLEDVMESNARMRTVAIAKLVPHIDAAYRHKINSSRDELMIYFLLAAFLVVVSGVLLFFFVRQMRKIKDAQRKLAATSKIQESYIGSFLGLCSSYADRLDSLNKLVSRKLSAGQADELLKLVKSGKLTEEGNDDFEKIFDNAFLELYPDFVFEVNKLLREEEQIVVKKGQSLTTELRIYAFVRLGVEESIRISQILHYSVSTIYAYRNKMRNKAIDRENFEADIMKIGRNY